VVVVAVVVRVPAGALVVGEGGMRAAEGVQHARSLGGLVWAGWGSAPASELGAGDDAVGGALGFERAA
jgi:hypothetical protein